MLRKATLLLLPLALLVAACGSDDDGSPGDQATATTEATAPVEAPGSAAEPTAIVINTPDFGQGPIALGPNDGGSNGSDIISAINPLTLLGGIDSGMAIDGVRSEFAARLLTQDDLPLGYTSMGEYSMSIPADRYGTMQMAMNMFASGDIVSTGELGSMVMSAVILLPPEAREEMGLGSLDDFTSLSDEDLRAAMSGAEAIGLSITDLRVLDGSGLGEAGAGIHMAMDFSGMMSMFGAPADGPVPAGMAFDMYMFFEGDYTYMVMVMYPTGSPSGVDARALAEVLDSRTSPIA